MYLVAPTVLRIPPRDLPARVRERFGSELRRSGGFAQLGLLGAQACLDAAGGRGPLGVLWSSKLAALQAIRAALDESLKRGEPAMPFTFIGMQPHLAGAVLAQRAHPVTRSAHLHLGDGAWSLLLRIAQGWLAECERILVGCVEESDAGGVEHRSDWCLIVRESLTGAVRAEPVRDEGKAADATAQDWIGRVAAWLPRAPAPLVLRGTDETWRFVREG